MADKKTYQEFSASVKAKYPEYKDVDDFELATKMVEKYPDYAPVVDLKKKEEPVFFGDGQPSELPSASTESNGLKSTPDREFLSDDAIDPIQSIISEGLSFKQAEDTQKTPDLMGLFNKKEEIAKGVSSEQIKQVGEAAKQAVYPTKFLFDRSQVEKRLENLPKYFPELNNVIGFIKEQPITPQNIDDVKDQLSSIESSVDLSPLEFGVAANSNMRGFELPSERQKALDYYHNDVDTKGNAVFNQLLEDTERLKIASSMKGNKGFLGGVENVVKGYYSSLGQYFVDYGEMRGRVMANPKMKQLETILTKINEGENIELTSENRMLAQMYLDNYSLHKELDKEVPEAYKIGGMGGTSAGFTLEFLLTSGTGGGVSGAITKGTTRLIAEGATVSLGKRFGIGLASKLAQSGIQTAWMPSLYKKIAEDVSKGEDYNSALFKNYYTSFAESFTERIFMKNPWDKSIVGTADKLINNLGINLHTDKGALGVLMATGEEALEEKISEFMTAPVDYNSFGEAWHNYWDVKKNAEMIASVALMTVPAGVVSNSVKAYDDVKLNRIGKLLPSGIRSELDVILDNKELTLKEQYDLIGKIVQDGAANKTLGDKPAEAAGNVIRYTQQKTKANVYSAVQERKEEAEKAAETNKEQPKADVIVESEVPLTKEIADVDSDIETVLAIRRDKELKPIADMVNGVRGALNISPTDRESANIGEGFNTIVDKVDITDDEWREVRKKNAELDAGIIDRKEFREWRLDFEKRVGGRLINEINLKYEAQKQEDKVELKEPTIEEKVKDNLAGNFTTFTYDKESDIPEALKDKITSVSEVKGKKTYRVTMSKIEADYLLAKTQTKTPVVVEKTSVAKTTKTKVVGDELIEAAGESVSEEPNQNNNLHLVVSSDTKTNLIRGRKKQVLESDENGNPIVNEIDFTRDDAEFELDRLELLAEKGRLTFDEFQKSYFGQSSDIGTLNALKEQIKNNSVSFIADLKEAFSNTQPKKDVVVGDAKDVAQHKKQNNEVVVGVDNTSTFAETKKQKEMVVVDVEGKKILSPDEWNELPKEAQDKIKSTLTKEVTDQKGNTFKVDYNLAEPLQKIINLGYPTAQSDSGTISDHPNYRYVRDDVNGRFKKGGHIKSGLGAYLSFWKPEAKGIAEAGRGINTQEQIDNIKIAASNVGFYVEDTNTFTQPSIRLSIPTIKDGTSRRDALKEANELVEIDYPNLKKNDFSKWIDLRNDVYEPIVVKKHGGEVNLTDNEVIEKWNELADELERISKPQPSVVVSTSNKSNDTQNEAVEPRSSESNTNTSTNQKEASTTTKDDVFDLDAKKADIERRRQEELNKVVGNTDTRTKSLSEFNDGDYIVNKESGKDYEVISKSSSKIKLRPNGTNYQEIHDSTNGGFVLKPKAVNKTEVDAINAKYDAELAELENKTKQSVGFVEEAATTKTKPTEGGVFGLSDNKQQQKNGGFVGDEKLPEGEKVTKSNTKTKTDEKRTDEAKGRDKDATKERQLKKSEEADRLLSEGLSDLMDLQGLKLSVTGEERAKLKQAIGKLSKGALLKGEVVIENLVEYVKDLLAKAKIETSDELISEALKEADIVIPKTGKEQKISQHYKKLIDPRSGVSKETRDILLNKDGKYDVITKAQLNKFADELIGSALIDGEKGLDTIYDDLKADKSTLVPHDLNGANVVVSYKLAYQYERLGLNNKAAEVDMWRKKFGTNIAQTLSAFDEMGEIPEQRIRRLRGELFEDRDAKVSQKGTTGKLISDEINEVETELNNAAVDALEKENAQLKKKIEDILKKDKGSVKAQPTLLSKEKAKQIADKIRSFRIKQDMMMSADPLTAAYIITRNGTLSLVAEVVEQTGNVSEAINKGLTAIRKSDWFEKLNNSEKSVYENRYRKFLKDEFGISNTYSLEGLDMKDVEKNVIDIINEHWTKVKKQEKSLETKLIEAGLDEKAASTIAQTAKNLVYDYVKENGLTNIKKLFKEKPTTKTHAKIRETASSQILNMIREGAAQSNGLVDALADFYGYGKFGFDLLDKAVKIANETSGLKPGIRKTMLLEEFESIVYELDHGTAKKVYDAINDLYNTSILSAPTTTSRAVKGMLLTGMAHGAIATIANPKAMWMGGMKYFLRGVKMGVTIAPSSITTGIGGMDVVMDVPTNVSYIRRAVNKTIMQHIYGLKGESKSSSHAELATKIVFHLPVKVYRSLLAIDAPLSTGLTEMEAFIKAYNDSMVSDKDLKMADRLTKVNERLARDNKTIRNIRLEVEAEIEDMKAKKEKIPPKYKTIRELELVELMRDMELVEVSKRLSKQALLMNKPEGLFTGSMYSLLRNYTSVKPEAIEVKDKKTGKTKIKYKVSAQRAAAALALKFIFPIIRVPANFLRTVSGYTPVGIYRSMLSTTPYLKGNDMGSRVKSSDERIRQAVSGAIGTTIGFALASMMFEYDDDDQTLVLSDDAPIKVTFMGTGDNTKNKTISKNYREISFSLRRPEWAKSGAGKKSWDIAMGGDDEWSDPLSYIDNPLGMILAPLGYVSDRIRYYKPKEDEDGNVKPIWEGDVDLFWSIAYNSMAFGTSQSYMQGANDLFNLIPFKQKDVPDNLSMDVYNFINRPVTALVAPNLYQFMYKQYNAAVGNPEKIQTGTLSSVARFIPSLEEEFNGERTDQFGYPVTREFMFPFVPDALAGIVEEWKDEKLRRGTNEWKLILDNEDVMLPRAWKADETHYGQYSDKDRETAQQTAKVKFREYVNESYEYLKDLKGQELQEELNFLREEGYNFAKDWLSEQKEVKK
jgi:hypothetical protein